MTIPVVDLSASPDDVAAAVDEALRRIGFMAVVGHGVPEAVADEAWDAAVAFFALDAAEKERSVDPDGPYGYSPLRAEALARSRGGESPPDLKESFNLGPFDRTATDLAALGLGTARIVWPERPAGFRDAWTAYYRAMEGLAGRLLAVMARALDLPDDHFAPAFTRHTSALRALHYPPLHRPPEPGQLRAGAHSDYGSLTILRPGEARGGLEVLTRDREWVPVPVLAGAFVVNIGDIMERWTNDRWVSTVHRVVVPPADAAATDARYSMAFFQNPAGEALVEVVPTCVPVGEEPRHPPVVFADWLRAKVRAATRY
jgi:isopenicillin N synthase-like dioxygenase